MTRPASNPGAGVTDWTQQDFAESLDALGHAALAGAMQTVLERDIPGKGRIHYEYAPVGYLTRAGVPRVRSWRAYFWEAIAAKRVREASVSTVLDAICPKDLTRYGEEHGVYGCLEAVRRELVHPHDNTPEDALERVREHKLGVEAATDRASRRGIDVHRLLEGYMRTGIQLREQDFPDEIQGYVRGLVAFLKDYDPEPLAVELLVCHPGRGYAGRADLKAKVRSRAWPHRETRIVDLKTSPSRAIWDRAHWQVQAYRVADEWCDGGPTATPLIVVVGADGRYDTADCEVSAEELKLAWDFSTVARPLQSRCARRNQQMREAA